MAINKIIDRNNSVLLDLSTDTVEPYKVLNGTKFHGPDGVERYGTANITELEVDTSLYSFIDYDGKPLYRFTDEELDALTELPSAPDHSDENLTFQEWNWTLEDLKNCDRDRPDRPIVGANFITTDEKTYLSFENISSIEFVLGFVNTTNVNSSTSSGTENFTIDWGDGTVETLKGYTQSTSIGKINGVSKSAFVSRKTHTYTSPGNYTIVLTPGEQNLEPFINIYNINNKSKTSSSFYITASFKIGRVSVINSDVFSNTNILSMNSPSNCCIFITTYLTRSIADSFIFSKNYEVSFGMSSCAVKALSLSKSIVFSNSNFFYGSNIVKKIFLHDNIDSSISTLTLNGDFPDIFVVPFGGITLNISRSGSTGAEYVILTGGIKEITGIPSYTKVVRILNTDNLTRLSFDNANNLETLDISKTTKVIPITSNPFTNSTYPGKIIVPISLLDSFKSASYWSNYADIMVGV